MNYLPTKLNILAIFMAFSKLIHVHGSIKIFQNSGTIYSKNYMYKTQPCHPQSTAILHTCFSGPDIVGNISASPLLVWLWALLLQYVEFLLWKQYKDLWAQSWTLKKKEKFHRTVFREYGGWGMAGPCFFTRNCCNGRKVWQSLFLWCRIESFLQSSAKHHLLYSQNFDIRIGIHCLSCRDKLMLHHSQAVNNTISMTCWNIVIHGLYFQGNALVCHSKDWHFISGS